MWYGMCGNDCRGMLRQEFRQEKWILGRDGHMVKVRKVVTAVLVTGMSVWGSLVEAGPAEFLSGRYDAAFLERHLVSAEQSGPFAPARERAIWEKLFAKGVNQRRGAVLVAKAEALLGQKWPDLPATLYMDYTRTGNRSRYEGPYFQRRNNLSALVLAECVEHRGRFLDEIVNGMWAIMSEASWCLPAHLQPSPAGKRWADALPPQEYEIVDLFACETAMVLAESKYLLAEELAGVSRALCARVDREVLRRVIEPVEQRPVEGLWPPSNWTPWCASNVLGTAIYTLKDRGRLGRLAHKLMRSVDRFIERYGADGGCEEGPTYWSVAAGKMLVFLELLYSQTGGAVDVYDEALIGNMGRFIERVHLDGGWFFNFSDAGARGHVPVAITYRYGQRVGDEGLKNLALLSLRDWRVDGQVRAELSGQISGRIMDMLRDVFWVPVDEKPRAMLREKSVWLEDLQVLVARQSAEPGVGLVLAAKGGTNAVGHNHNDVGHFVVCLDGQPGIVDVGVETYRRETFSGKRYDIWCIRGSGHNAPVVNGVEQVAGGSRRATAVEFTRSEALQRLGMNLEEAYPAGSRLEKLRREFVVDASGRGKVTVQDAYRVAGESVDIVVGLYAAGPVERMRGGVLGIDCGDRRLLLEYDAEFFEVGIEEVSIEDGWLQRSWGQRLYRIEFEHKGTENEGEYSLSFAAEPL